MPNRSPKKPVQIKQHKWLYQNIYKVKTYYLLLENWMTLICKTLSPLHPRMFCAKFGCSRFWRRRFLKFVNYFRYSLSSLLERGLGPSFKNIWSSFNQNCFCQVCLKFSGFGGDFQISSMYFRYFKIISP